MYKKTKAGKSNCTCKVCGLKFWLKKSKKDKGWGKYCSRECQAKDMPTGEKSNNWKGGLTIDINKYKKKWREKNKDYVRYAYKLRRLRMLEVKGEHTFGEWETLKAQYNWTCPCCLKKEPDIDLTEDHIVPITRGGSNNIENIQPLCKSCNSSKYTKIIKYPLG